MASSLALASDLRSRLETVRQILGLSQGELAALAGISQGNVCNCLKGQPVRLDSLRRLLSAFASRVSAASDNKDISAEQVQELRKVVDAARKAVDGSVETSPYFAPPGPPMPESAANRLRRPEDRKLLSALDGGPFTAAIIGPPECGKTTLLQLLLDEARRRGFAVVDFDARLIPGPDENEAGSVLVSERFLPELAVDIGSAIGERPSGDVKTALDLVRFLKETRSRRPAPPLLIAVDHAEAVELAPETVAQICRALDATKGRTQVSWVLVTGFMKEWARIGPLSRLSPHPQIELSGFTLRQVRELADFYEIQDECVISDLWEWFLGQPCLTHAALDRFWGLELITSGKDLLSHWPSILMEARLGQHGFGFHLDRLQARLQNEHFWSRLDHVSHDAESFVAFCRQGDRGVLAEHFGLLNPGACVGKPAMPLFYHHHFSRLRSAGAP